MIKRVHYTIDEGFITLGGLGGPHKVMDLILRMELKQKSLKYAAGTIFPIYQSSNALYS